MPFFFRTTSAPPPVRECAFCVETQAVQRQAFVVRNRHVHWANVPKSHARTATDRAFGRTTYGSTAARRVVAMKTLTRHGLVGLVGLVGLFACSTAGDPLPDAAAPEDASPGDATTDGTSDSPVPFEASTDAPLEASPDGAADASDSGDANDAYDGDAGSTSDSGDASDSGDSGSPPPLFAPGESGSTYELRATCTVVASARVGAADSCCRQSTFTETTTCDTVLREEPDGAGSLVVVVEPMQNCVAASSADTCTRSGTLARCDSSGLTCPFTTATYGAPSLVAGTYVRRTLATPPTPTFADHYWSRCATVGMVPFTSGTCSPTNVVQVTTQRMAVFTRTGPGKFRVVRSWAQSAPLGACSVPSGLPAAQSLASNTFVDGMSAQGGSFGIGAHQCTYELTKK